MKLSDSIDDITKHKKAVSPRYIIITDLNNFYCRV